MNIVIFGVKICEGYLDVLVVYFATWSEHINTVPEVFYHLIEANFTLNLAECETVKAVITSNLGKQVLQREVHPVLPNRCKLS